MKKYILFIVGIFATLTVSAQCVGITATGTSKARVSKVCYDSVMVSSFNNLATSDSSIVNQRLGIGTTTPESALSIDGKYQASKMWSVRKYGTLYSHQIVDTTNDIYGVGLMGGTYLALENKESSQDPQLRISTDSINGVASLYSYWTTDATKKHKLQLKSSGDLILMNTNNDNLIHTSTGNIGLGTSSPGSSQPSGSDAGGKILELNSASPTKDVIVSLVGNSSAVSADWWMDRSAGNVYLDNRYDATTAKIGIRLRTAGTPVEALSLWGTGDLGVGLTTTPAARLHLISTTSQFRNGYDASNYMSVTTGSTGTTTLALAGTSPVFTFSNQVNVSSALTCTGIFTTNSSNVSAANLTVVGNTTAGTTGNNSQILFSGASNMAYRVLERNSTTYTLPTGVAYAGHIIGEQPITTFSSGSHPMISSLVIKPPTVTNAGATTDTTATLYIAGSGTSGTQNYSLRVNGPSYQNTITSNNIEVPSGGTGIDIYNTADKTTNYERLRLRVSSNVFVIGAQNGGTGTLRGVNIVGGASTLSVGTSTAVTGAFNFNRNSGTAGISIIGVNGSFTQSSGTSNFLSLIHTVNQSSTAGYRSLWISPYQQATGSGVKYLIDVGTNSAADGGGTHTSLFRVDNTGLTTAVKYSLSALNTAPSSAADTGTTGEIRIDANYIYICTATNTWKRVAIATW